VTGVAREKKSIVEDFLKILFAYVTPRIPMDFFKKFQPIRPSCLAIYMSEELYYIDVIRISLVYTLTSPLVGQD